MVNVTGNPSDFGLENHGLTNLGMIYWTLPSPSLVEQIVTRREGLLAHLGAVVVRTGHHTGRAANDKFIVNDSQGSNDIWWGEVNRPFPVETFNSLHQRMTAHLQGKDVFVQDVAACAHSRYRMPVRIITENAWHSLFARNLFLLVPPDELGSHKPEFTILHSPRFHAIPEQDGTHSEVFVIVNFERRMAIIAGTSYAGEIKKTIFTVLNYLLPKKDVLSMHCSANKGERGDVALFFGLSGTGKTTLSSDPDRHMIGDDEHGWAQDGIFNFEGGSYAKTIRLSSDLEPVIWEATRRFGTVLENVGIDAISRRVDFADDSLTENTRAGYPMSYVDNHVPEGRGDHPENLFLLTADAFGVLPPIARLSPEQAVYYFLSGYTSKLAGTEQGLGSEPEATFSACFGAPFLPLHPTVYGQLLGERLKKYKSRIWLLNTGWTGGRYGDGERIRLEFTRAMVSAALTGGLADVPYRQELTFGLSVPERCPGVPDQVLDPKKTWADPQAYDKQAAHLAQAFAENFKQFAGKVPAAIVKAGPGN